VLIASSSVGHAWGAGRAVVVWQVG